MNPGLRATRPATYLFVFAAFALILFLSHAPYLSLPYFWDELGQFVPAALDIQHDGAWVPRTTVPNAHPPGVMAYLALVWQVFGYSIVATRLAMLTLAAALALVSFLLAIRLCRGTRGTPAFLAVFLLLADPLFHAQAMMAQLDMPAALFATLALLLFLEDHQAYAVVACTLLVLVKETGIVVPFVFAVLLLRERRIKTGLWYITPLLALIVWFLHLHQVTGHWFGDSGFTHYNLTYPLNPARLAISSLRRFYDLFLADFRWIGLLALWLAWRNTSIFRTRDWAVAGLVFLGHVLLVTILGGAALERYLLPALPILYAAFAAALTTIAPVWRAVGAAILAAGLIAGWFLNPPFPFPYENNLAMTDFVRLQQQAAAYLEEHAPNETVYTAWPFTAALRRPEFGYIHHKLDTAETDDLRASTLRKLSPGKVKVLVLYSRTWDPPWGVLRIPAVERYLARYYDYEQQLNRFQAREDLHLERVARWDRGGQWIEIYRAAF